MKRLWRKYLYLLERDLCAKVFDNVKNLLVCALLFAAGSSALREEHPVFHSLLGARITGAVLILISALLLFLTVSDGLHRVARTRRHIGLQLFLGVCYLVVALRIVEMVWSFRAE